MGFGKNNFFKRSLSILVLLFLFVAVLIGTTFFVDQKIGLKKASAAGNRYWVGGGSSANWNATGNTNWGTASNTRDNASVPDNTNDVIFDNSANGNTPCTISALANAKSINFTGWTNTLTHNSGISLWVSGSITFVNTMTYSPAETAAISMRAAGTLTTNGTRLTRFEIYSGALTLGDNLTFAAYKTTRLTVTSSTAVVQNGKTISGDTNVNRVLILSGTTGTSRTITVGGGTYANANFIDIGFDNGGVNLDLSAITGLSGDGGGNSMVGGGTLTFTTAAPQTWTNAAGGSWSTTGNWTSRVPLPQDNATMNMGSNYNSGVTVTADMLCLGKNVSWTGTTWTGTATRMTMATENWIFGDFTLLSTMNFTSSNGYIYFAGRGTTFYIDSGGQGLYIVNFSNPTGTYQLSSALSLGSIFHTAGTFNTAGYAVTTSNLISTGSITRALNITNSTISGLGGGAGWAMATTGLTFTSTGSTLAVTSTSGNTIFSGSTLTYNNITMASSTGYTTFSGAFTFNNMTMSSVGTKTVKFTKSTTYTMTGNNFLVGTAGNLITLTSDDGATAATLNKSGGGTISSNYLDITVINVTPATTWYYGNNSSWHSGTGWVSGPGPSVDCYWLGTTSTSWNNAANWSSASGGTASTCNSGANIPGLETTVHFDAGSANNPALLDITTTVAGLTTTAAYAGTITLADNTLTLTATAVTLNAGTVTIADQSAYRTKMTMTSLTVAGGTFTNGSFNTAAINGNFTESSGTVTNRSSAAFNITSGDFDVSGGTFTNSASGTSNTGVNLKGNSSNIVHAPAQMGYVALNKTAGQTLTLQVAITATTLYSASGTLNTNGQLITIGDGSTGTLNIAGQTIDGLTMNANPGYISGSLTVNGTVTVNTGKECIVQNSAVATFSDTGRLVLNGTGKFDSYLNNPGTLVFTDDAANNLPNLSAGNGLSGKIKIIASTKDVTLLAGYYYGRLEINNNSGSNRTVTLGTGTFNIGNTANDTEYGSGLYLSTDSTGTLTLDGAANSPTVNLLAYATTKTVGHISFTGAATKTLKAGTANTWSLVGNLDLTNGTLQAGTSTFNFNGTGSQVQTLTSNSQSFYNLTVANTNATGFSFADGSTVTGTFRDTTATSKVTFHSTATYTIADINIAGTAGGGGNNLVTLKSSTGASAALFNVSQTNPTVTYVTVSDSNASGGNAINATGGTNTNGGGNTFWNFTAVVPAAPTIGTATGGNAQASVTFTPPADNGGSPITGYTVTSTPGSHTGTGASSPIVVGSLTNGTSYTFTVHATNAIGNSAESAASNSVTPSTVPGAPTGATAVRGNAKATVSFTPPVDNGGSAITGYTVTSTPGSFTGTGAGSPIDVNGLTNGTSYTFTVHATNANGNSAESAASNAVTPATIPDAPTIGTATAGSGAGQATVTFTPPGSDGGSTITGYTVTSTPSSITGSGAGSPITVSGLANGTAYTFTVHATNDVGNSSESAASNSITTFAVPGAPTIGVATGGNAQASVTFSAPGSDGGTPITGYTVTSTPGSHTGTGAGSPIVVGSLTNGTSYTFTVHATNIVGNSTESAASNAVVPSTIPDAPTAVSAVAGNAKATITFTIPVSDGGSAITGYTVTSTPGSISGTGATSPIDINGLTNGTAYTFTVHATNINGDSAESVASSGVTPSAPPTPVTPSGSTPAEIKTTPIVATESAPPSKQKEDIVLADFSFYAALESGNVQITVNDSGNIETVNNTNVLVEIPADIFAKKVNIITISTSDSTYLMNLLSGKNKYQAVIPMPAVKGNFELKILIVYEDGSIKEIKKNVTVDPQGFVYAMSSNYFGLGAKQEVRISDAKVTLYKVSDGASSIWDSGGKQPNPTTTNKSGEYAFWVPNGEYYLQVEKAGYKTVKTNNFSVKDDLVVQNVMLEQKFKPWIWLVLAGVVIMAIFLLFLRRKRKANMGV